MVTFGMPPRAIAGLDFTAVPVSPTFPESRRGRWVFFLSGLPYHSWRLCVIIFFDLPGISEIPVFALLAL